MILLWGVQQDKPLMAVCRALHRLGLPVIFLDQWEILNTGIELDVDSEIHGILHFDGREIDLDKISGAYLRPYDWREMPDMKKAGEGSPEWKHAIEADEALISWLEITPALVINRLSTMASNNSKPYQSSRIRSLGFLTPDTLITTEPRAVMEFLEKHGSLIYKSISGVRSIVSRLTTKKMSHLSDIMWCPTQFQEYIPGNDYRVHVVGNRVFSCEIISEADDYRYARGAHIDIRSCEIPQACADRCRELTKDMGLAVAGIDLRLTPDGRWYCFEVNPSPGFTYYQEETDQPIDEAIARLLAESCEER